MRSVQVEVLPRPVDVAILSLRPGDVLVARLADGVSADTLSGAARVINEQIERAGHSNIGVVVTDGRIELSIVRPEEV